MPIRKAARKLPKDAILPPFAANKPPGTRQNAPGGRHANANSGHPLAMHFLV